MVFILVNIKEISITSPSDSTFPICTLSPSLNGLDDNKMIPAIALLIVFLEENPMIDPTPILMNPATVALTVEN